MQNIMHFDINLGKDYLFNILMVYWFQRTSESYFDATELLTELLMKRQ